VRIVVCEFQQVQSRIDSVCVVLNGEGWVTRRHYPSKINSARLSGRKNS